MAETATCHWCKETFPIKKMKKSVLDIRWWICKDEMECLRRSERKVGR